MKTGRRGFLRSLLIAAVAPSILVPKFKDAHKWKRTETLFMPNPAYVEAEYKIQYCQFTHCIGDKSPVFDPSVFTGLWEWVQTESWKDVDKLMA